MSGHDDTNEEGADRMRFGFGLITAQRRPDDPRTAAEVYRHAVDLGVHAERLGFDSLWLSEHHFIPDGYLPSVMTLASALAVSTTRIDIGTGILIAPLHHPIRLAEDTAVVDLLSGGRVVMGVGTGWRQAEFEGLDVERAGLGDRISEMLAIMRRCWTHGDTGWGPAPEDVTPKPVADGGPPVWVGASRPGGLRRIARDADGYLAARVSPSSLADNVATIHEELERIGRRRNQVAVGMHMPVFAWPDEGEAWELVRSSWQYVDGSYADMADTMAGSTPLSNESRVGRRGAGLFGTPEQVAEAIAGYRDAIDQPLHFIARMYWPGIDPSVQAEAMSVFMEAVVPLLRERDQAGTTTGVGTPR